MRRLPPLLGLTDVINRWGYTRQAVHNLTRFDPAFPKPAGALNDGRNRYWLTSDIESYERDNPRVKGSFAQPWKPALRPEIEEPETIPAPPSTSRYRVFYAFSEKPPFAFREALKKAGWRYDPDLRQWIGIVTAADLSGIDEDFERQGGRRSHTVPLL